MSGTRYRISMYANESKENEFDPEIHQLVRPMGNMKHPHPPCFARWWEAYDSEE